ncbi:hypothetical protein DOM21_13805 [Bacteriovorax stolpii]|uniref:Uncharacterized protein n=1 Tax=Bacteriovorax stolpii TaxID=960 RepID=A0A2K9NR24_BACTC|nr:hypothetical protein [Bacteriovorax stolpii]AUN97525.1 hypothetical protein C0V70_05240 [Bacteriovorax stolpii]QDK42502.1 hypothetical protein DOM21_13805 [Bacteriovorax stolpii]TDP52704.1 hypothetical protein C8D79_2470 [Bacteriovorax stolpii]
MKTRILVAMIFTLAICKSGFPSGTTIGNGISVNSAKKEKICKIDGKEVKRPIDDKCEEVLPETKDKKEEAPAPAPKK